MRKLILLINESTPRSKKNVIATKTPSHQESQIVFSLALYS